MSPISEEATGAEPMTNDDFSATPGLVIQQLEKNGKCQNQATSQVSSLPTVLYKVVRSLRYPHSPRHLLSAQHIKYYPIQVQHDFIQEKDKIFCYVFRTLPGYIFTVRLFLTFLTDYINISVYINF